MKTNTDIKKHELAAVLQDMWHYAALIKPPSDGRESTFVGDRSYAGLIGKLKAFETLLRKVDQLSAIEDFQGFYGLSVEGIHNEVALLEHTGYIIHAINTVAAREGICAYQGKVIAEMGEEEQAEEVLRTVRNSLGRAYKTAIRTAWFNGNYSGEGLEQWASQLQAIRNDFGPSWLENVRL